MHEAMVAESVLSAILVESEKAGIRPVRASISCGQLNAINNEVLRLAFEALAIGTICEGIQIDVEQKPFQGRCRQCDHEFEISFSHTSCPICHKEDFEMLPDAPILLETIEFEE